jgi:alcohol dehydrogenase (cytochrome c)
VKRHPGPGGYRGEFIAWDAATGRRAWAIQEKFPVFSGALVTASDIVFYGTVDGYFKAVDARTGALLWQTKVGSGVMGEPMTYMGPDGKQYVAVLVGIGGAANVTENVPGFPPQGGMLYVFGLP